MNIKFLKLVSGEDVLSEVEEKDGEYILKNPTRIIATREGIGLGPLNPLMKDDDITVGKEHVVYVGEPDDEIRNGYSAQFGGIILPPTGLSISGD
jgi:hypothetical protein